MTKKEKEQRKQKFLEYLPKTLGIIGKAAEEISVHPNTISRWRKEDLVFDEQINMIQAATDDFVESKFYELIKNGNKDAILFYLKTRMKDKYTEIKKVEVKDLDFRFNFGKSATDAIIMDETKALTDDINKG